MSNPLPPVLEDKRTAELLADGWTLHDGGPCPVDPETRVSVLFLDGTSDRYSRASYWGPPRDGDLDQFDYWIGRGGTREAEKAPHDRIIAYRVVRP